MDRTPLLEFVVSILSIIGTGRTAYHPDPDGPWFSIGPGHGFSKEFGILSISSEATRVPPRAAGREEVAHEDHGLIAINHIAHGARVLVPKHQSNIDVLARKE